MRKLNFVMILALVGTMALAACGGDNEPTPAAAGEPAAAAAASTPVPAGDASNGQKIFTQTCVACHGTDAKGVQGLGKDLTTSDFIAGLDDSGLVEFIKKGRDPGDPLNTTGVAMPPKAGNPAMTEQQMFDVVAYVRSLHMQE